VNGKDNDAKMKRMKMSYSIIWKTSPENVSTTRNSNSSAQPVWTTQSSRGLPTSLLADGREEGASVMQHLYWKRILPEFLQGADAQLYCALVTTLQPVMLHSHTDYFYILGV